MLANYFVLFLSLIAISAEIHERAPTWIEYINENVDSVKNCSVDRDTLFECVSEGNFSGLIASVILYASHQSVATKSFCSSALTLLKSYGLLYTKPVLRHCAGVQVTL